MTSEETPQSIRFYATAKGFFQMVHLSLLLPAGDDARSLMLLPPRSCLIGFALELYFKAWLSHDAVPATVLRSREYGHNLVRLYSEAVHHALTARNEYQALVNQFGPRHADLGWRYLDDGDYLVTNFEYAMTLLDLLDDEVDAFIGASASKGLAPGRKAPLFPLGD